MDIFIGLAVDGHRVEGGEAIETVLFGKKVVAGLLRAAEVLKNGDAVFFTHFLVINAIVGRVLEHPETLYFWPDNGSVTHLRIRNEQLELVELGQDMKTVVN